METPNTSGDIDVLIAVIQPQENLSDKTFLPHFDIITSALLKIGRSPKFSFYQPSELVDYRNKPPTVNPVLGQRLLNSHFILIDYNLIGPGGVAILRPKFSEVIGGSISDYR